MISEETYKIVKENATILDSAIIYDRDFNYNLCVLSSIARRSVIYPPTQLWFQNSRAIVLAEDQWCPCRAAATHAYACCRWDPRI